MIYIYALRCPETGVTRYIGKTTTPETRLKGHVLKAQSGRTNHHCAHWIRSLLAKGLRPEMVVVDQVPDGGDWKAAESKAIQAHRLVGCDLTNLTGGGEGFHDCPKELLIRRGLTRSKTLRDPVKRAEFIDRLNTSRNTSAVKAKQSRGVASAWKDPVKRARLLAGMRTPEAVARRAAATTRRMTDPEIAARHKAQVKERFQIPEHINQLNKARAIRWSDPTQKVTAAAKAREYYQDPAHIEEARQASVRRWAAYRQRQGTG